MSEPATQPEATPEFEAAAAGLVEAQPPSAEPEEEVEERQVDTSAPRPEDDEAGGDAEIRHLPIRQDAVAAHELLGTLVPVQDELRGIAALAVTLAMANNVPKALQNNPAGVLAVILTGRELGVAPMTAIRTFHVIDGTVTVAPKVRAAMVRQQGLGKLWPHQAPELSPCPLLEQEGHGEACRLCAGDGVIQKLCRCGSPLDANNEEMATWHAERTDQPGVVFTSTYTKAMAGAVKFAKWGGDRDNRRIVGESSLLDKDNWKNYPDRMLSWRSLGYLLDDAFPEVGTGLYSPDEIGAVTDEDGAPILDVESTEALVPPSEQQRRQQRSDEAKARRDAPPPPDPPANPETLRTLQGRIDKLRPYPGALDALKTLWTQEDDSGNPKLPPIAQLLHRHERVASAMIDLIERRADKGDFGKPAEGPPAAQEPAEEPAESEEAPAPPEPAAEQEEGPEPALRVDGLPEERGHENDLQWVARAEELQMEELLEEVVAEVKALGEDEVLSRSAAAGLNARADNTRRRQLTAWLIRNRMERIAAGG